MSIIELLASSLNRRDNIPNQELAREIAETDNYKAIRELIENLNNKDKKIQGDCIKVLYETGYIKPELIANYHKEFIDSLFFKNYTLT